MPTTQSPTNEPSSTSGPLATRITLEDVAEQVRTWVSAAQTRPVPASAKLLSDLLKDPKGLQFTLAFVDRVIRTEDPKAAAVELRRLAQDPPAFLPPALRRVVSLGGSASTLAPQLVVPTAQAVMRQMVSHLILDARPGPLTRSIARMTADGTKLNINPLGEAVLGAQEAARRLTVVRELTARPDVDYVSIKVSSIVDHLPLWAADQTVDHIVETLLPLYLEASRGERPTFLNMDMEEYHDLELTLRVFEKLLDRPELAGYRAGIVLQAYLPDAPRAMEQLRAFAERRVAGGGAPIKVRLVKGANLALEKVDASLHGWPQAPLLTKEDTDAQYKRMLMAALDPQRLEAVNLGVAGHNLFDIAFAHLLMRERGIRPLPESGVEFEMLAGMAPGQQAVVRESVGSMRLYVPVVAPQQFDVAVSYLVRRLEENASSANFMSAVFELDSSPELFEREQQRFARSLMLALDEISPETHRVQDRTAELREGRPELGSAALPALPGRFRNTPDTDMSTLANQRWADAITRRLRGSRIGMDEAQRIEVKSVEGVHEVITRALEAQQEWAARPAAERAGVLREVARTLAAHRAELLEVAAAETGKTLEQGDPEISEAVDFALYYADQAEALDADPETVFTPRRLTLVTPPWNFPIAIPTGSMLAPLVTGSAVVMKPAPQARRCGALLGELMHQAGVPEGVLTIVDVPEDETGRALISDERVDQLILTGGYETAELFASWRPELRILAETSGKNAIVVSPHADLDLAAKDVAASAFGHAGQKCSAASLVITIGSVSRSRRFMAQLADAVLSLHVGHPLDATVQMGPVIEEPGDKLAAGLTELGAGETWLARPQPLDDTGRLFSPGVREGVKEGSEFHLTEYFGPVLGLMHAPTLADAVRMQNGTAYGLTAGLHSLEPAEVAWWTENVEAGNLYINRGITGAIVERQSFGGWKRSAIGQTAKAGGPNYLVHLMEAADREPGHVDAEGGDGLPGPAGQSDPSVQPRSAGPDPRAEQAGSLEASWLAGARHSDREHLATTFAPRDVQDLHGEVNVLRYRPLPVMVRAAADARPVELERVLHAAVTAGAKIEVSIAESAAAADLDAAAQRAGLDDGTVRVEDDAAFADRIDGLEQERVRLVGSVDPALREAISRRVEVALFDGTVVSSGRVELLAFLREQAISATDHRYGNLLPYQQDLTGGRGWERGPLR